MDDIISLQALGEDGYEAAKELIETLEQLPQEQKSTALHALADLFESLQDDFSNVRRINQPVSPDDKKTERVDVLVNWLREKA